ncbi:HEAT repeat domain-containing protein [Patescibacteria group bacterium]|nr:HEAT repeat domain-containing protein [Patescibacteria group bacterium]MCL5410146.1 HEAT repeat domain-containing protein [Patescibacteria group bacterium]
MAITRKLVLVLSTSVLLLSVLFLGLGLYTIHRQVESSCQRAKSLYPGDCVEALLSLVSSEQNTFRERNNAIWALGQIANPRALPTLTILDETLAAQTTCSYDEGLCKFEVEKAIKWIAQGNLTSWMYQGL